MTDQAAATAQALAQKDRACGETILSSLEKRNKTQLPFLRVLSASNMTGLSQLMDSLPKAAQKNPDGKLTASTRTAGAKALLALVRAKCEDSEAEIFSSDSQEAVEEAGLVVEAIRQQYKAHEAAMLALDVDMTNALAEVEAAAPPAVSTAVQERRIRSPPSSAVALQSGPSYSQFVQNTHVRHASFLGGLAPSLCHYYDGSPCVGLLN